MTAGVEAQSASLVWQTRLSREAAAAYEQDLETLGLDRSEALRRGLRLLHREALEVRMARDVADFYPGGRAPVSDVTAAAYGDPLDASAGPSADRASRTGPGEELSRAGGVGPGA